MRQAAESEIIQLTMKIRNNEAIIPMKGNEVQVYNKSIMEEPIFDSMLLWADQIIVATNKKRIEINNRMRKLLSRGERPEDGDKVICLRNYWEEIGDDDNALVNGTIGTIQDSYESFINYPWGLHLNHEGPVEIIAGNFISDSGEMFPNLRMDKQDILTGEPALDYEDTWKIYQRIKNNAGITPPPLEFTYGYAITGHKSQRL